MNRIGTLPYFEVSDYEDIEFFIRIFIKEWDRIIEGEDSKKEIENVITGIEEEKSTEELKETKSVKILRDLLRRILKNCIVDDKGKKAIRIYYAERYDDRYYRDMYSVYYSRKHFPPRKTASRFFLFDSTKLEQALEEKKGDDGAEEKKITINESFIGSMVRRPLRGREIGRTLINPCYIYGYKPCFNIWRNRYRMTLAGIPLEVWAFPFSMQDGEISTCAETTILNMMDYYSARYPDYKNVLPSELSRIIRKYSNVRNLPSNGLSYEMVSKAFMELGFTPMLYAAENFGSRFSELLHSYVASGIPVALAMNDSSMSRGHSVIVIGTKIRLLDAEQQKRMNVYNESSVLRLPDMKRKATHYLLAKGAFDGAYIIMDDGQCPYSCAKIYEDKETEDVYLKYVDPQNDETDKDLENTAWKVSLFAVPLSPEMLMDAEAAINCFKSILKNDVWGYSDYIHRIDGILNEEYHKFFDAGLEYNKPLLTRIFLCPSKRLKEQRTRQYEEDGDYETLREFQNVHFPRFVWVCELYTQESFTGEKAEAVGEIVLDATDATSSENDISDVVWLQYPWKCIGRNPNQNIEDFEKKMYREDSGEEGKACRPITPYKFELH